MLLHYSVRVSKDTFKCKGCFMEYFWRSASSSNSSAHAAEISIPLELVSDMVKETSPSFGPYEFVIVLVLIGEVIKGPAGAAGSGRLIGGRQGHLLVAGVDQGPSLVPWASAR